MIPIYKPHLYKESERLAISSIKNNEITIGKNIEIFEKDFSKFCNRKYGVTCSNGTVALYLAVKSLNLPKNSEVILPSMTILSCLTAIVENDLNPVFCDINPITYNIDFQSVRSKLTTKTSAIIVVNTYGLMINTDELNDFKKDHPNIKIIEDASESHGASHKDIIAGSIGDISTFSFYSNKIVTTGEGGMILTDDSNTYENLLMLKNLNFIDRKKYIHSDIGFNFRLTNLQCSIGLGQLKNIKETIKHRKRVAYQYNKCFRKNKKIQLPYEDQDYNNVYWYYSVLIKENYQSVLRTLKENEIDYRHFFHPLHKQPFIKSDEKILNSEIVFESGILLPTYNKLSNSEIKNIARIILKIL